MFLRLVLEHLRDADAAAERVAATSLADGADLLDDPFDRRHIDGVRVGRHGFRCASGARQGLVHDNRESNRAAAVGQRVTAGHRHVP